MRRVTGGASGTMLTSRVLAQVLRARLVLRTYGGVKIVLLMARNVNVTIIREGGLCAREVCARAARGCRGVRPA